jgi:hypothetical protein
MVLVGGARPRLARRDGVAGDLITIQLKPAPPAGFLFADPE